MIKKIIQKNWVLIVFSVLSNIYVLYFLGYFINKKSEIDNAILFGFSYRRLFILILLIVFESLNLLVSFCFISGKIQIFIDRFKKQPQYYFFTIALLLIFLCLILSIGFVFRSSDSISLPILEIYFIISVSIMMIIHLIIYLSYWKVSDKSLLMYIDEGDKYGSLVFLKFCFLLLSIIVASACIIIVTYIVMNRINYPFELEWMEGGSLIEVERVRNGLPIYVKPTLNYIPFIYPPFYFILSALLKIFISDGFLALRLLSFLSTVGICYLIHKFMQMYTANISFSIIAIGIFCSMFRFMGAWFDVARVDMLFFFLMFLAFYLITINSKKYYIVSGFLLSLSMFTKQSALIPIAILLIFSLLNIQKNKYWFKAFIVFVIFSIFQYFLFQITSKGWFAFYLFGLPSAHRINISFETLIMLVEVFVPITIYIILFCSSLFTYRSTYYFAIMLASIAYSITSRLNPGGYQNTLIPLCTFIAIGAGVTFSNIFSFVGYPKNKWLDCLKMTLITCLFIVQVYYLRYPIQFQIPPKQNIENGYELVSKIRSIDGEVYIQSATYLNLYANKKTNAHWIAIAELCGEFGKSDVKCEYLDIFNAEFVEEKYSGVILSASPASYSLDLSLDYYLVESLPVDYLRPVTGAYNYPSSIYLRK